MKVLLFTHKNDIDGMGNAILANLAFDEVDYVLCGTFNLTENILKYEYFPIEKVNTDKKDNILKYTFIEGDKMGIRACIGYNMEEELQVIDILDGHIVVGGASRWGKSSFLNVFITNIMLTYTPNEAIFAGCDFKKSDIYYFRKYKHFKHRR